jgi:hypothetical protein
LLYQPQLAASFFYLGNRRPSCKPTPPILQVRSLLTATGHAHMLSFPTFSWSGSTNAFQWLAHSANHRPVFEGNFRQDYYSHLHPDHMQNLQCSCSTLTIRLKTACCLSSNKKQILKPTASKISTSPKHHRFITYLQHWNPSSFVWCCTGNGQSIIQTQYGSSSGY